QNISESKQKNWLLRIRLRIVVVFLLIFQLPYFQNLFGFSVVEQDFVWRNVGVALVFLGFLIAIWARSYLGRNWNSSPKIKHDHELVTSGPYHLVRHPIYTGILLMLLGSAITFGNLWTIAFIFYCIFYIYKLKVEEVLMESQFQGEYLEYKKRTKMLIPYVF
ncbi:isoprenylcysteine carboxylmethyltransferase family protein, partial [Patescibacteria group bacterium]